MCGTQFVVPGGEDKLRKQAEEEARRKAEEARRAERLAEIEATKEQIALEAKKLEQLDAEMYGKIAKQDADEEGPTGYLSGPGQFAIEVVGESHYQDALEDVVCHCGKQVEAVLILDDSNPYDPRAVQIEIEGRVCGYLSRADACAYRRELKKAGHSRLTGRCRAIIVGRGPLGVLLDLPYRDGPGRVESWRAEPATDRQKAYADDLGITHHEHITKGELSDLISAALGEQ